MITNKGKTILSKYLVGQAPAYASYIALGCGAKPLSSDHTFTSSEKTQYAAKTALDFEMFRIPIISRGYIDDNGVSKIIFTAELPTEERYDISEVGIYSAGANPDAGAYDSKTLFSFSSTENWEYHRGTGAAGVVGLTSKYTPLDDDDEDNIINDINQTVGTETFVAKAFQTNSDNTIFSLSSRVQRYEVPRYLNNIIALSGDLSDLSTDGNNNVQLNSGQHIHLNGISLDFDKQSAIDELRLAFSVINRNGNSGARPNKIMLLFQFSNSDEYGIGQYASFDVVINHTAGDPIYDLSTNRYFVVKKQLQNFTKTSGFSWSEAKIAKVYATVLDTSNQPSDDFFVCLDAVRLENVATENPLYGMTGYSVILNNSSKPITKLANTTNFIEFRFGMDVQ